MGRGISSFYLLASLFLLPLAIIAAAEKNSAPWPLSTPSREGLDPRLLTGMLTTMRESGLEFRSLIIVKGGKLVASVGFDPFEPSTPQNIYSATKSFLTTLVGIARDEGLFPALDSPVAGYLDGYDFGKADDPRRRISFAHLLSQSSGYSPIWSWDFLRVVDAESYVVQKPLVAEPGSAFLYNSGTLNLLSAALQKATGMRSADYAASRLMGPLGIDRWAWPGDGAGVTTGGTGLCISAIDLARLGYLYLRGGMWNGHRLVSREWISEATTFRFRPAKMGRAEDFGYGYLWWLDEWGGYSAHGSGGQYCYVIPDLDLVVVFTASLSPGNFPLPWDYMKRFVLPAAGKGKGKGPAPDPEGDAAFAALAEQLGPHGHEPRALPMIAKALSGATFVCAQNPLGIASFRLDFARNGPVGVDINYASEFDAPLGFEAGTDGLVRVAMGKDGVIAARAEWEDERRLGLLVFDMQGLIRFSLLFDATDAVQVHVTSATYGFDTDFAAARTR